MQTTKEKILGAVISYIKDGVNLDNISLSKIASVAEIGKSTVYEHFESKEILISETHQYLLNQYEEILFSDINQMTFKEAFKEQICKILVVMKDAKNIMDAIMNNNQEVFMSLGIEAKKCVENIQLKMNKRFQDIIYLGVIENVIENKQPKPYIKNIIQAIISGLLLQYVNKELDIDEQNLVDLVYENMMIIINN